MTRQDYRIYLLWKEFDNSKAHDFLIKCRKRDRLAIIDKNRNIKIFNCDDYGSWIEKTIYPYEFSADDIEEFIEDNWQRIYSMYDCTGKAFTRDIRCFPINGKTIVYHFKSLDI